MSFIPTSASSLRLVHPTLGTLYLMEDGGPVTHDDGYTLALLADGTDFGNSEAVVSSLLSMMADGSLEVTESWSNRAPVLSIEAFAEDYDGLSAADVALAKWADGATSLEWLPPAGEVWTVFDVVRASLSFRHNDLAERRLRRLWSLSFSALPFARSADLVVTPALEPSAYSPTSVDTCASTTGWSSTVGAVATTGGYVYVAVPDAAGFAGSLVRTGSVDFSATRYLTAEWQATSISGSSDFLSLVGYAVVVDTTLTDGWRQTTFDVGEAVTSLTFIGPVTKKATGKQFRIRNLERSSAIPTPVSSRQQYRQITVGGSARTQGSLHLYTDPASALGKTLIYTHPVGGGYQPPLRRWRVSSDAVTSDSTMMSGARNNIVGIMQCNIPVESIPRGTTQLWGRFRKSDGTGTVGIYTSAFSVMGSTGIGSPQGGTETLVTLTDDVWTVVPLATFTLPNGELGPDGYVRIDILGGTSSTNVQVDEAWLFALDEGALTVVDCGTGTLADGGPSSHLWIDAPNPARPNGALAIGNDDERSDSYWPPDVACDMLHNFDPEGMNVFVASEAEDVLVELEHYRRWHTHAAE